MREAGRVEFGAIAVGMQDLAASLRADSNLVWVQIRQELPEKPLLSPEPRTSTQNLRADELSRQLLQGESLCNNRVVVTVLTNNRQTESLFQSEGLKKGPRHCTVLEHCIY